MTASTPGMRHAGDGSRRTIRAYGCGDRSVAPHSMPSAHTSDEKAKRPCTFGTASGRVGLEPMPARGRVVMSVSVMAPARRRAPDRSQDPPVTGAPAEVAGQGFADLEVGRGGTRLEKIVDGDDETGRAEAALHRALVDEGLLDVAQLAVGCESFDRGDVA